MVYSDYQTNADHHSDNALKATNTTQKESWYHLDKSSMLA